MNAIFKELDKERKNQENSTKKVTKSSIKKETLHEFCTGSKYDGTWDSIGMRGYGSFNFYYGVDYDGDFTDSMFHERGTLMYPNEAKLDGFWDNGRMVAHRYFYSDNLCFGPYCEMPDRRYHLEVKEKLKPAGRSFLTNSYVTRKIPPGCYDAGDGFYDPEKKCVFDAKDHKTIIRIPSTLQHNWIVKNCRKAWDEPVGYKPALYENWQQDESDSESYDDSDEVVTSKSYTRKSVDYLCYKRNSRLTVQYDDNII